ncbi:hypothetical protein RDI58_007694 [Solanum bulbocastanum]|uniref:Uncharacterized protein n=1 Tax=Solanum bulbocastanum TaxID=147425 RepID=A0AAN8U185_SOLBU
MRNPERLTENMLCSIFQVWCEICTSHFVVLNKAVMEGISSISGALKSCLGLASFQGSSSQAYSSRIHYLFYFTSGLVITYELDFL